MKPYLLIATATILLSVFSCEEKDDPIGQWDDIIRLSEDQVSLTSGEDSVLISTEGDWWWIGSISFEDSLYTYTNREDINLEADDYQIHEEDFTIERRNAKTLFILMEANQDENERTLTINLEAGNYFDHVTVTQTGK